MSVEAVEKTWTIEDLPSPRHLRVFEAVARQQSFTRAAEEVRLTQPAITQAVAKLEALVGRQLLERAPGGASVTDFGQKYLIRTRRFFQHIESALTEISAPEDSSNLVTRMFRITRTQIRCHVAIARSPSFAQAAIDAGISQPSLHRAARDLELNLGVSLYRNSSSGMVPTEAGRSLARWFLLSLGEMRAAAQELSAVEETEPDVITIGVQMLDPAPFLAAVMESFTKSHPDCSIRVVNSTYDDLLQRVRLGLVDFIVGVLRDGSPDLHTQPLFPDPYVVAGRRGHPLAGLDRVTAEELLQYDWIVPNPGAPRRKAFDQFFREAERAPRTSIESHSYATIRATLCEGDRLAILTRSELLADERLGVLQSLNAAPLHPTPVIGFATRDAQPAGQRVQAFMTLLQDHAAAFAGHA
jgi:LysR family transcriptional regulator of gallate degradation